MNFKCVLLVTIGLFGGINDGFAQDSTDIITIEQLIFYFLGLEYIFNSEPRKLVMSIN